MLKHKPERSCVVCRKKSEKKDFIKVVKNKNGEIGIELTLKLDGRGAYLCKNEECIKKAIKTKIFNKVFKSNISQNFYEGLENEFKTE